MGVRQDPRMLPGLSYWCVAGWVAVRVFDGVFTLGLRGGDLTDTIDEDFKQRSIFTFDVCFFAQAETKDF
jgi:hypothetical protein